MRQVRVFLSYAHEDREWCERLLNQLGWLRQSGQLAVFDDQQIRAGEGWDARIRDELEGADIVVPLVSPAFLGSRYCTVVELLGALKGRARVIPVVLDHVDFAALPLSELQALPKDERQDLKPLVDWDNPNRALAAVAKAIREAVGEVGGEPGPTPCRLCRRARSSGSGQAAPESGWGGSWPPWHSRRWPIRPRRRRERAACRSRHAAQRGAAPVPGRGPRPAGARGTLPAGTGGQAAPQRALDARAGDPQRGPRPGLLPPDALRQGHRGRFARADRAQERALAWVEGAESPVLYLTGDSSVGKSSLLDAWLVPELRERGWLVVQARGLADPATTLAKALRPRRPSGPRRLTRPT